MPEKQFLFHFRSINCMRHWQKWTLSQAFFRDFEKKKRLRIPIWHSMAAWSFCDNVITECPRGTLVRRCSYSLKDELIFVLYFLFLRKFEMILRDLHNLANNRSCCRQLNAFDKSANKAPHFPLRLDFSSVFQMSQSINFKSCTPLGLFHSVSRHCLCFNRFDHERNFRVFWI